jgi:hypothetical protein
MLLFHQHEFYVRNLASQSFLQVHCLLVICITDAKENLITAIQIASRENNLPVIRGLSLF